MSTIASIEKDNCCGCTACFAVCPTNAIKMKQDEQGFWYPQVNEKKCCNCGQCIRVCKGKRINENGVKAIYAARNCDEDVLFHSSSGGVSQALCQRIIELGGSVYGVAYSDTFEVITKRATTLEQCEAFYGSKYVQTNLCNTFNEALEDLKLNRYVLFFGTSCHIAKLLSFLAVKQCNIEKLITVDLICHGVPSPKVFRDYIQFVNEKKQIKGYSCRTKYLPWGYGSKNFGATLYYQDGTKKTNTALTNLYLSLFFSNNCLRPYCFDCPYVGVNKQADITIADYWGIQEEHPEFFSEKGVSAVILNTLKGVSFFEGIECLIKQKSTLDKVEKKQGNMHGASQKSESYELFWNEYRQKGFVYIARKYGRYNLKHRLRVGVEQITGIINRMRVKSNSRGH